MSLSVRHNVRIEHWRRGFGTHSFKCLISSVTMFLMVTLLPNFATAANPVESNQVFQRLELQLANAEERIKNGNLGSLSTRSIRQSVEDVVDQVADIRTMSSVESMRIERLLAALGPAPEDGVEDTTVRSNRTDLSRNLASHQGLTKRADLIIARAEQALTDLTRETRLRFQKYLFQKSVSPLDISSWTAALPELVKLSFYSYVKVPAEWVSALSVDPDRANKVIWYLLISLVAAAAGWPLRRWFLNRYGRRLDIKEPSYANRLLAAFVEGVAYGLIPVLFVIGVGVLFTNDSQLGFELRVIIEALVRYLAIFFIGYGLIRAVFTPDLSAWRLTPLHTGASTRVVQRLQSVLVIFVVFGGIGQSLTWASPSDALESTYAFAYAVTLYPALWALLRHRVWRSGDKIGISNASPFWARARNLAALALLTIPISAAMGYPKFALFLIDTLMRTGVVVSGFLALRWLGRSAFNEIVTSTGGLGYKLRAFLELSDDGASRLRFWLHLALDFMLLIVTVSALLPVWGVSTDETLNWLGRLFRGVKIGSYTFSLLDFVLAITFFAAIMLATRLIQRGLERHFLPKVVRDIGVRDALRTGIGYIGVLIASLVGISTFGLDLSNLALIAGALTVGLGFGLQNIVSNFVSGLILLAERPIKPGDWIIVGGHEGTVKKVNVRSTEIETFQRASVIIPNADLIATPVTNWTHKNALGRLEVRIGVAYGTDVNMVRDTLLELARAHPMVLSDPEPAVVFSDFGASSLDFELRCFLHDIGWVVIVASELRFSINDVFAEKGIDIPFPQRVVHLASPELVANPIKTTQGSGTPIKDHELTPSQTGSDGE